MVGIFPYTTVYFLVLNGLLLYALTCANAKHPGPVEGQIRLANQEKKGSGRVEIYHNNEWGTICNDYWDIDDATVVCRELGYPKAINASTQSKNGNNKAPIWLDNVRCEGIEDKLTDCASNGWGTNNCDSSVLSEDAAVECQAQALPGDVCLRDSRTNELHESRGHVHIFEDGKWLLVCDDGWGITESNVVCRQLGLIAATNFSISTATSSNSKLDNVTCNGTEKNLGNCSHNEWNTECKDGGNWVHVTCSRPATNPDSAADALYYPSKYCLKSFNSGSDGLKNKNLTLDVIRNSAGFCIDAIPSEITCEMEEGCNNEGESVGTICNRRIGFTCDESVNPCCQYYNVTFRCPCENENVNDVPIKCIYEGSGYFTGEFSVGEMRLGEKYCEACTCSSQGEWLCDYNEKYCKTTGPPPFEATCFRPCDEPPFNRTCHLQDWIVEWFVGGNSTFCEGCLFNYSLVNNTYNDKTFQLKTCPECIPLDGISRAVAVVNRMMPGPAVHVCEGDRIIVKVVNKMTKDPSGGTTIHWHGMFMENTQYMDGAFMVTQCPIPIGEAFIYDFWAFPAGTHWWHSHAGLQRGDGVNGALVVRQPKNKDVNGDHYDFDKPEHLVVLQDWAHRMGVNNFNRDFYQTFDAAPGAILINGNGGQTISEEKRPLWCGDSNTNLVECPVPRYEQFNLKVVEPDKNRFRFRVISTAVEKACALRVSVDNHNLTIISTDGQPTKPYTCRSFVIFNAERYDFVLTANQPPGNYWMRVTGERNCKDLSSLAIVHYESSELKLPVVPKVNDDSLSAIDVDPCDSPEDFMKQLNSNASPPDWVEDEPEQTFYIGLTFGDKNVKNVPKLNNITFKIPSRPFLLQAGSPQEKLETCSLENKEQGQRFMEICGEGYCDCSHVINIKLGKVVELFFVNMNLAYANFSACHPMHLHGFNYRVVAEGQFSSHVASSVEYVKYLNENGLIDKKPVHLAIQKDTMVAPENGYTAVRFKADNPGYWFLHCHFEAHLALGMVLVIHVGERSDLPEIPKEFPKCGDWPIPRANDGEAFIWSEVELGNIDPTESALLKAVNETLEQSRIFLQYQFTRPFGEYKVTNNRLKTDPVSGFHYFLFKIDTGDEWYVHVQLKASTNTTLPPKPVLTACQDSLNAADPLLPITVSSENNLCKPPAKKVICSATDVGPSKGSQYGKASSWSVFLYCIIAIIIICIIIGIIVYCKRRSSTPTYGPTSTEMK